MSETLENDLKETSHSKLFAAYAISEDAVAEQLRLIHKLAQQNQIEPIHVLAKAYVFGNLVNVKWLYYPNHLTDFVKENIREQAAPLYCQDYIKGIAHYAYIIKLFKQPLTQDDQLEQYIAYELYQIINLSDDLRQILNIPLLQDLSSNLQEKLKSLNNLLVVMLWQAGNVEILVDYNEFFLRENPHPNAIQLVALLKNYETVASDFSVAPYIREKARVALFDIYLNGKLGVVPDQNKALTHLENILDTKILEDVAFDLYEGSNSKLNQDKVLAHKLMARCYNHSSRIKNWTQHHEPTWYAEFERREQAINSFNS